MRQPYPLVTQQFDAYECETAGGRVAYRLFTPSPFTNRRLPLLVWFHGLGESGVNNLDQLVWLELLLTTDFALAKHPCAILAVQSPSGWQAGTIDGTDEGQGLIRDPLSRVEHAMKDVLRRWPVDRTRIYGAGVSDGAVACWDFASRSAEPFAAIVPMGLSRPVQQLVPRHVAVRAFQSTADGSDAVGYLHRLRELVVRNGGSMQNTVVQSPGHDCWTVALRDDDTKDWLFDQRLGRAPSASHLVRGSYFLMIVNATVGVAILRQIRRRYARQST